MNGLWLIWELTKPVIAQVHGWWPGRGEPNSPLCATSCSWRRTPRLGYPPVRALTTPDTMYFPWKMPMSQAKYLMFTGKAVTGEEAVEIGWATKAFPADSLEAETLREARAIATISPDMLAASKKAMNRAYEIMGIRTALEVGVDWQGLSTFRPTAGGIQRDLAGRAEGLRAALQWRDGPFEDYSARPR